MHNKDNTSSQYQLKLPCIDVLQLPVRPADPNLKTFLSWMYEGKFPKEGVEGKYMRQDERHNYYHLYFYAEEVEPNRNAIKLWRNENKVKCTDITYDNYRHIRRDDRKEFFANLQNVLVFDTEKGNVRFVGGSLRELSWTLFHYPDGQIIAQQRKNRFPEDPQEQTLLLEDFKNALHSADLIVGHNIMTDIKNIHCACKNLGINISSDDYPEAFCTSRESLLLCRQASGRATGNFDTPTLQDLSNFLELDLSDLNYRPSSHSSRNDTEVTRRCFLQLMHLNASSGFLFEQ